jgi:hypothetical protein
MGKEIVTGKSKEPTIFEDSIIAGLLLTKGHRVNPIKNPDGRIVYEIEGDTNKTIQDIYTNCPVGALDVMRSIKLTRSMIFNLKAGAGR